MVINDNQTTINKEKIAHMIKSELGLSNSICAEIVEQTFTNIQQIAKVQRLSIKGFGSFKIKTKKPRPGVNFHTKEKVVIPAKKVMQFTPAKKLKILIQD